MRGRRARFLRRRAAGMVWLMIWVTVLYVVAAPWRELGGIVDERLRWLEWFVLIVGLSIGFTVGRFGRDAAGPGTGRAHIDLLRCLLYPLAVLTVVALVVLISMGRRDPIGVVVTAFLAYWAGIDLAFGAVPLIEGQPYGLLRPVDPEPEARRESERDDGVEAPPWERY